MEKLILMYYFCFVFKAEAWRTVVTSDSPQSGGLSSNQIARDERTHSHEVFEPHEPDLSHVLEEQFLCCSDPIGPNLIEFPMVGLIFLVHPNVHFAYKHTSHPSNIKM